MKLWTPFSLLTISLFGVSTSFHESYHPSANRNTRARTYTNERQNKPSFKPRNPVSDPTDVGTPLFLTPYIQSGQILQGILRLSKILLPFFFLSFSISSHSQKLKLKSISLSYIKFINFYYRL